MKEKSNFLKKIGVVTLVLAMSMVLFTACGPKTLEDAFQDEEVQEQLSSLETSGVEISAAENTLIYTYTYSDAYDFSDETVRNEAASALEEATYSMESQFQTVITSLEDELGIDGISVKVSYCDSKGDVIYETLFEK